MIPKRIHYIWFGGNPLPQEARDCIASWEKYCPDFEIVRWDETNFDLKQNSYIQEAYEAEKWAFVSDYARLWVLVNYGGVYMDTDVELLKPIDPMLRHRAFSGFESNNAISTGIMGCERDYSLFRELLSDYDGRHFLRKDGTFDMKTNVVAITDYCLGKGLILDNSYQLIDGLALYPSDWFCPKSHETGVISCTDNTVAIHHFSGSWMDESEKEVLSLRRAFLEKHPAFPPVLAGALVRLRYGFEKKDFKPFLSMARSFLEQRAK